MEILRDILYCFLVWFAVLLVVYERAIAGWKRNMMRGYKPKGIKKKGISFDLFEKELNFHLLKKAKLERQIDILYRRLYASVMQEDIPQNARIDFGSSNPVTDIARKILEGGKSLIKDEKNTMNYNVATPKEIEQYLLDILDKIEKLRETRIATHLKAPIPPFVFIIDELDKMEPDYYFSPGDRESDEHLHHNDSPFHISTKARLRQEAIAKLLANLKSFLNNADAKFVFIGGRGMYDAALADIADRESFYSSIFNEVIYIESFFKDKLSKQAGLTQITESYLCRLIMPEEEDDLRELYSIKSLIKAYELKYPDLATDIPRKFKVIHALQNLVIFLTYRSNGSPKKLIELIERYIVRETDDKRLAKLEKSALFFKNGFCSNTVKDKEASQLYLKLSYKDQYEVNLNSSFYRPYLIVNSKYLKGLGDKLLYSTAFLIDHILKFHKSAFSWRNLEQIPDIILANKDPNFRYYFSDIMSFLSERYLRKTVNAVFQYKFNSRISNEIKYLSKISEFSAAAFNFTLDESYHLKSYYKKKLAAKYKEYNEIAGFQKSNSYIHSIGYLHSIIGDLHYYDEEYDDAIIHYTDSVQALRHEFLRHQSMLSHQFVLYARNTLNLGLCLEKTRSYDKAYSVYRSLIIQLKSFQKSEFNRNVDNEGNALKKTPKWEQPFKRMQLFLRPHIALFNVMEKQRQDGITYDNLERNIYEYLNYLGLDTKGSINIFPLNETNGEINYGDINLEPERLQYEAKGANNMELDKKRLVTLVTDYYFSVGGILFYKNQIFYRLLYSENTNRQKEPIGQQIRYNLANKEIQNHHPSHTAYLYYLYALINFNAPFYENIKRLKTLDNADLHYVEKGNRYLVSEQVKFITNFLDANIYKILNNNQFNVLANICGKLGDALLSCLHQRNVKIDYSLIECLELFKSEKLVSDSKGLILRIDDELSLKLVLVLYRLSYHLYQKARKLYSAVFQYKKVLYILRDSINESNRKLFTSELIEDIGSVPIKAQISISSVSNRAQLTKYRFHTEGDSAYDSLLYNNLSTSPDVKEIVLLVEGIKRKIEKENFKSKILIGPYSTINSMFARTLELKFQGDLEIDALRKIKNGKTFEELHQDLINSALLSNDKNSNYQKLLSSTVNGFFCLHELNRILNVYGNNYIMNHSFLAAAHRKLAIVSVYYQLLREVGKYYQQFAEDHQTIEMQLIDLLGPRFKHNTDPYYHSDLAKAHYEKAISLHTEGKVYRALSQNMFSLDDDFNDNLTHFCAANERYRMNIGQIEKQIDSISKDLESSGLNDIKNYFYE